MKVSVIQFNPLLGDEAANMETASSLIQQCKDSRIIVLPELANSGYRFKDKEHALSLASTIENSQFINLLKNLAKQYDAYIISGFNELDNGKLYNSAVLIGPSGYEGLYRKIHLFMDEKQIFERGNAGLSVFEIDGHKMGMLICFDYMFPELWRIMALKGAAFVCHPSNLITRYPHKVTPVQALMNRIFILTANRYGEEKDLIFRGESFISSPEGEIIAQAEQQQDQILTLDIDLELSYNKFVTAKNSVIADRSPEDYKEILD